MARAKKGAGNGKTKKQRAAIALIFGENKHDTDSVKELLVALHPELEGRLQSRREPTKELKHTPPEEFPAKVKTVLALADVEEVKASVRCLVVHEDCDEVENAHIQLTAQVEAAYTTADRPAFAATPAWEIEAWWFMWPECAKIKPSWRQPDDHVNKNVGKISHAKQAFERAVTPKNLRTYERSAFRGYIEADSPRIARRVREREEVGSPQAQSQSFTLFVQRAGFVADTLT
jgi:hypothetical protein